MIVEWEEHALNRLTDFVVQAGSLEDQRRITTAVEHAWAGLAADPWEHGESRAGLNRVWFVPPVVLGYHIDPGRGSVRVFHVALLNFGRTS